MLSYLKYFVIISLLTCILLSIPYETVKQTPVFIPLLTFDLKSHYVKKNIIYKQTDTTEYHIVYPSPTHPNKFYTFTSRNDNNILTAKSIPNKTIQNEYKELAKTGYITCKLYLELCIWYSKLGRRIFYFDNNTNFLWEKPESRYIAIHPKHDIILAVAGDQSEFELLNLELESQVRYSSVLLLHYQFSHIDNSKFDSCFGFLKGDILFAQTIEKKLFKYSHHSPIKSLYCNFRDNTFIAHAESKNNNYDEVVIGSFHLNYIEKSNNNNNNIYDIKVNNLDTYSLNSKFPYSIPIAILKPTNWLHINIINNQMTLELHNNNNSFNIPLNMPHKHFDISEYQVNIYNNLYIMYNSHKIYILTQNGLIDTLHFSNIQKVHTQNGNLVIQTNNKVIIYHSYQKTQNLPSKHI